MRRYRRLIITTLDPNHEPPVTLRQLCQTTGIPVATLHNYASTDALPRMVNLEKLAKYFGVDLADLLIEETDTAGIEEIARININPSKLRYKHLLKEALQPDADEPPVKLRQLARDLDIPVPSLHNYIHFDTLPRVDNIQKISEYFGESISSLFSEDDDTTAALVSKVRKLSDEQKEALLRTL